MYTYEERKKAVELYILYDFSASSVIRELGYPNYKSLIYWYREYVRLGKLKTVRHSWNKYSEEEKQKAIQYYNEHGKCISRTVKALGYPSRPLLDAWLQEACPDYKKHCYHSSTLVHLTAEEKKQAVMELCTGNDSASRVARKFGVTSSSLLNWKRQLLGTEKDNQMSLHNNKPDKEELSTDVKELTEEVRRLQKLTSDLQEEAANLNKQVHHLQLEKDILEKAAEILKKDQGVSLDKLMNHEKAMVIGALRKKYPLKELLSEFNMAKSSYCYQATVLLTADKYSELRKKVKSVFDESRGTYGYRRIHSVISSEGTTISEKIIRRIMTEDDLNVRRQKKHHYSSYQGEISPAVPNLLQRDFHADKPNEKWLTDITEFSIPSGKVYLSPIIDCFDGMPVSWTIGTSPNAELANTMLDMAIASLHDGEHPVVHSDRGAHYRWPGWIQRMNDSGLIRSMSKKGCSPDNSACEGFFGRLKNEMFYGHEWKGITTDQFIEQLNQYINWYAYERIKLSLGGMSPMNYRKSLGLIN